MLNIKMGKTFVRGKENYSVAEKKELGELVEKYKKEDDKEVKAFVIFLCKRCLLGQTKRKGTLLTLFRPLPDIPTPPRLLYFTKISNLPAY